MTSVPNHPPRLSGNNFLALLIGLFVLTITSCDALKPAVTTTRDTDREENRRNGNDGGDLDPIQSRRVYDPTTGTYIYVRNSPTEKMDTVRWTAVPEDSNPPIVEDGTSVYIPPTNPNPTGPGGLNPVTQTGTGADNSRLLSAYNVELALPFLTDRYLGSEDAVDPNSEWALHYYAGAQLALDEIRTAARGNYNVTVRDTEAKTPTVQSMVTEPVFQQANLVVGPYLRDNVGVMANAVKGRETVLVSPYSAAGGISENNPNYVQVNPTLNTHLRALLAHAYTQQRADRIVLVGTGDNAENARLAVLQEEYLLQKGDATAQPLEVLTLDINDTNTDLSVYLRGRKTVFIVPIYRNEAFVANFLRLLYAETRDDNGLGVAVYGLPQWMDFTRINFDYFEGTNVHVSSSVFIDQLDPAVRDFQRDYYARYAVIPRDEAYVGYDVTRYFLRMLNEHGTRFQFALPSNPEKLLHTRFSFQPVYGVGPNGTLENAPIQRFENKYVNILRFKDSSFRRVN